MYRRQYYFPEHLHNTAEQSGIAEIADKIDNWDKDIHGEESFNTYTTFFPGEDRADEEVTEEIELFASSDLFRNLDADDKIQFLKAYNIDRSKNWRIIGSKALNANPRLFELDESTVSVPCDDADRLTLSGAGAKEYVGFEPNIFESYKAYGFDTKLAFMQFAGAWLCNKVGLSYSRPSITIPHIEDPELIRKILMGGDIHGDFRMEEQTLPILGALTPIGSKTAFAPVHMSAGVAAYHSVEKDIVTAACAYVMDSEKFTQNEKSRLFEVVFAEEPKQSKNELGANFFGDFGDDDFDDVTTKQNLDIMRVNAERNIPYLKLFVSPYNRDLRLLVEKSPDGNLSIRNTGTEEAIVFRAEEIPELLQLFANIGEAEARTSTSSVMHAISCAYEELRDNAEAGHILYSDSNTS